MASVPTCTQGPLSLPPSQLSHFVTDDLMLYCTDGVKISTPGVLDADGFTQWV